MQQIKITNNNKTHIYRGSPSIQNLREYTQKAFKITSPSYTLEYIDEEGDHITVSCNEDLEYLAQTQKIPKIFVSEISPKMSWEHIVNEQKKEEEEKEVEKPQEEIVVQESIQQEKTEEPLLQEKEEEKQDSNKNENEKEEGEKSKKQQEIEQEFREAVKEVSHQISKSAFTFGNIFESFMTQIFDHQKLPENKEIPQDFKLDLTQEQKDEIQLVKTAFKKLGKSIKNSFREERRKQKQQKKSQNEKSTENKAIHRRHICDGCSVQPIVGNRFHCEECPDFDFCQSCFDTKLPEHQHKKESFKCVEKPVQCGFPFARNCFFKQTPLNRGFRRCGVNWRQNLETELECLLKKEKEEVQQKERIETLYNKQCIENASKVSEILGENFEVYLGVCKHLSDKSLNFIVDELLYNPKLIKTYPTEF